MRTCYIYELSGEDGVPFYIGSSVSIKNRGQQHRSAGRQFHSLTVIDECHIDDRIVIERMYIQSYLSWGFSLHNTRYTNKKYTRITSAERLKNVTPSATCKVNIKEWLLCCRIGNGIPQKPRIQLLIENAIRNKAKPE